MTATRKTWTEQDHDEATSKADALGMKVYGLASMLKVCAFAAEARRTLTGIEDALEWREKVRDDLRDHVHQMTAWAEIPDASGDALEFVAQELERAMADGVDLVYGLAHRLTDQERASSKPQAQGRAEA